MTITAVSGQQGGTVTDNNATGTAGAYAGNVTAGNLVIISASMFETSAAAFVAGDCTKASGTATLGTISLDKQITGTNIAAGIWSAIVTGTGSLTMQVGGASGDYWVVSHAEFASTLGWDSSRVHDSKTGSGNSTTHLTASMSSTGAAIFYGQSALEGVGEDPTAPQSGYTLIFEEENGGLHQVGSSEYKIVSSSNSDTTGDNGTGALPFVVAGVVYQEVGGGTAALGGSASTGGSGTQAPGISIGL
jgi:hypothetical protein